MSDSPYTIEYWKRGTRVIEECLKKTVQADPLDVPFPLVGNEAKLYHWAQMEAYRHALEMMGYNDEPRTK